MTFKITISTRTALVLLILAVLAIPATAYGTHIFADVSDSNVHAEGIEFMKNSGVSIGCQDGTVYCPGDPVTRAQMGTFMYRLSGNDPATAPSVNADRVDGRNANQLVRVAYDTADDDALVGVSGTALTTTIDAPSAGFLLISASSDLTGTAWGSVYCQIVVNDSVLDHSRRTNTLEFVDDDNCATDGIYLVLAGGTFTVDFDFELGGIAATTTVDEATLTVLFVPFGSDGSVPTAPVIPFGEAAEDASG